MNQYFSFDHQLFDYWPLYDSIKRYYPVGLATSGEEDPLFQAYPGQVELWELLSDNIVNAKNYRSSWTSFLRELRAALRKPVHSDTGLARPCFDGYVTVREERGASVAYTKELRFVVSLLGPYFSIYGLDQTSVQLPESLYRAATDGAADFMGSYSATHAVTVSPHEEYAALFTALEQQLGQRFAGYRLVPFAVGLQVIKGLPAENPEQLRERTVFEALFGTQMDFLKLSAPLRGNAAYGQDAWRLTRP